MSEHETERIRSAYRKAVEAIEELRGALAEAGLLPKIEAGIQAPGETPEERRRRLARERSRRRRERDAVTVERDAELVSSRSSVTRSRSNRDASVTKRDAVTLQRDATGVARTGAFLIEEVLSTSPLFPSETSTPRGDDDVIERDAPSVTPTAAPVERSPAPVASAPVRTASTGRRPRKGDGRERPSLAPGSTIGVADGSPAVQAPDRAPAGDRFDPASDVGRVWTAYLEAIAPTRARLTSTREALLVRRLREYSVDELVLAVRGYGRSAWHRGDNDRGRPYQAVELWLRDAAHIEAGLQLLDARAPAPRATSKKGAPSLDGMNAEWEKIAARQAAEQAAADRDVFAEA